MAVKKKQWVWHMFLAEVLRRQLHQIVRWANDHSTGAIPINIVVSPFGDLIM